MLESRKDIYFDHGSDLAGMVVVRDHEVLFAYDNENDTDATAPSNSNVRQAQGSANVGWLGYVVSKIKLGANALGQAANGLDADAQRLQLLKQSGLQLSTNLGIVAMCFGLNAARTKVLGYTLRRDSIECVDLLAQGQRCGRWWTRFLAVQAGQPRVDGGLRGAAAGRAQRGAGRATHAGGARGDGVERKEG